MRWHYRDPGLLWLSVPVYGIHLAEEWAAGFPEWLAVVVGAPLPKLAFIIINSIAMKAAIWAIRAATRAERHGWMAIAIATVFLVNTLAHIAAAALTSAYSPGLVSAVVLYAPLGSLMMIRAFDQASRVHVARGITAGLMIHAVVFMLAFLATRLTSPPL